MEKKILTLILRNRRTSSIDQDLYTLYMKDAFQPLPSLTYNPYGQGNSFKISDGNSPVAKNVSECCISPPTSLSLAPLT